MPVLNPEIFREYDIRGRVGSDLTSETVRLIGRAYGTYLQRNAGTPDRNTVIVGRDNRASSDEFRDALLEGLTSAGCEVIDIGLVVTPILYFSRVHLGIDGAVMITGSHNPPDMNGFKLCRGLGTIYGEEIQKLRGIIETGDFVEGKGLVRTEDVVPAYFGMMKEKIMLGPRKLKVVVDAGNGTASFFAPRLLEEMGCEVVRLYCDPDPRFPNHHPDPVKPENVRDLQKTVLAEQADLGLAYDGDADRIGAVDDRGNIIWGDTLMILYWREILPKHAGTTAIIEVKCSQALVDEVERLGGRPMFYKTGHSLIKAKMREIGAVFTGEMSGHMFFADEYFGYDDAFYASGRLLRILSNDRRSFSEMTADLPRYYSTPETRVDCPDRDKFSVVERVRDHFRKRYEVIDVDGARVLFPQGWGLVRASNTQPVLVVRCEARTPEALEEIKGAIAGKLAEFESVDPVKW